MKSFSTSCCKVVSIPRFGSLWRILYIFFKENFKISVFIEVTISIIERIFEQLKSIFKNKT